jgi:anti-sigma-K factor RskA
MSDRDRMTDTHDCGADAAAYVLGALEPAEAEAFRAHLDGCAICRDEVDAFQGTVQALPMAAQQVPMPKDLKRRVMRDVRREPKLGSGTERRRGWRSSPVWHRPRAAAAALVAAVVAAAASVTALELAGAGAGALITAQVSGISGTAQLRVVNDHGELIVRHLTAPGRGKVYEVWVQAGRHSQPLPASVLFAVNSGGNADVSLPTSLHGVSAVLVTPEPLGGSRVPTHTPVISARLS